MLAAKLVLYIQREPTREFCPAHKLDSCRLRIQHQLLFPFTLSCAAYFCRPGTRKPERHVTRTRVVVRENSSDGQEQRNVTNIFVGHTEYSSAAVIKITDCFGVPEQTTLQLTTETVCAMMEKKMKAMIERLCSKFRF